MIRLDPSQYRLLLNALRKHFEKGLSRQGAAGEEIKEVSAALGRLQASAMRRSRPGIRSSVIFPSRFRWRLLTLRIWLIRLARSPPSFPGGTAMPPRKDAPNLENEMGWAEIVGPEAPFKSDEVCFGLTLIGAHSTYPPHRHPARELYLVLAGRAAWTVEIKPLSSRPALTSCTSRMSFTPCAPATSRCSRSIPGPETWFRLRSGLTMILR